MPGQWIGKGRTADVFEHSETTVLKLFNAEFGQDFAQEEFRIASEVSAVFADTPRALRLEHRDGRHGIVYEKIVGQSLLNCLLQRPLSSSGISKRMALLHWNVANIAIRDTSIPSLKKYLGYSIKNQSLLTQKERETILNYLEQLPSGDSLCHGDFHPDNIIQGEKLWIIDWMTATRGDPAADAARTMMLFEFSEIPGNIPLSTRLLLTLGKKIVSGQYLRQYCSLSGKSKYDIDQWKIPVYANRLRENLSDKERAQILSQLRKRLQKWPSRATPW